MSNESEPLKQLARYARIARNSQMLLVMEPVTSPEVEQAREAIAHDSFEYLTEVLEGVESPYFQTYTSRDRKYIELSAADRIQQLEWDRIGVFDLSEPKFRMTDASEAQAANFAYLAASCMRQIKAPFFIAPNLRASVHVPQNVAEFVETIGKVKNTTLNAAEGDFHQTVNREDWRTTFAFWESNRWLASNMVGLS